MNANAEDSINVSTCQATNVSHSRLMLFFANGNRRFFASELEDIK